MSERILSALVVVVAILATIPVVGAWVNSVLDGVATALQGMAVAYILMQAKARIMPSA